MKLIPSLTTEEVSRSGQSWAVPQGIGLEMSPESERI